MVVTGTLAGYTREEAEAAVLARGGKSPGTVSAKTFALVVGESPGASKVSRAEQLGIPVVSGVDFEALLSTGELPGCSRPRTPCSGSGPCSNGGWFAGRVPPSVRAGA